MTTAGFYQRYRVSPWLLGLTVCGGVGRLMTPGHKETSPLLLVCAGALVADLFVAWLRIDRAAPNPNQFSTQRDIFWMILSFLLVVAGCWVLFLEIRKAYWLTVDTKIAALGFVLRIGAIAHPVHRLANKHE